METNLNTALAEAVQHMTWVRYVYQLDGIELSVSEADKHTERFIQEFYPEHYKVLFE